MLTFSRARSRGLDTPAAGPSERVERSESTELPRVNREETDLVARLRAGDDAAFEGFYALHNPSMVRVAATIVSSRATAEDVAQEAWVAVLRNIAGFEERSSFAGWLFTILVNLARTRARRDGRTVSFDDDGDGNGLEAAFDGHGRWRRMPELWDEITPERIVAGRRLADRLDELIDGLPPGQRDVLVLRVQRGLDPPEVCALLGLTEANMRVLLHRARVTLRARLAELT